MKYQLLEHVSFTQVDDEAVLLDLNTGTYFGLNHVGTYFLNIVRREQTHNHIEKASQEIALKYQIEQQQARSDLQELVEQLIRSKLLKEI